MKAFVESWEQILSDHAGRSSTGEIALVTTNGQQVPYSSKRPLYIHHLDVGELVRDELFPITERNGTVNEKRIGGRGAKWWVSEAPSAFVMEGSRRYRATIRQFPNASPPSVRPRSETGRAGVASRLSKDDVDEFVERWRNRRIPGTCDITPLERSRTGNSISFKTTTGKKRYIEDSEIFKADEIGIEVNTGRLRKEYGISDNSYARAVAVQIRIDQEVDSRIGHDFEEICRNTSRKQLIFARLGQGVFRRDVLRKWHGACAVTGCTVFEVIRASHIKPWAESNDMEKLDPDNGLPLLATLDALFDAGLISFRDDGRLIESKLLPDDARELLDTTDKSLRLPLAPAPRKYLEYHRTHRFQD